MKNLILRWSFFVYVFLLLPLQSFAQWEQTGPYGGWVYNLFASENTFYAASTGGVLSSTTGSDWTHTNYGLMDGYVQAVITTSTKVFAGTLDNGVFVKDLYGMIWEQTSMDNQRMTCFAKIGDFVFAGTYSDGVYLTTDNGSTWTQVNNGLTSDQIECFAVSGNNIFCGAEAGGVFLSTNFGANWTAVNTGLPSDSPISLGVNGSNVYVGLWANGIWMSPNNGQGWIFFGNPVGYPSSFAFIGSDIYVCGRVNGIYKTTNDGADWTKLDNGISSTSQINEIVRIGNTMVVSEATVNEGSKGLYYSYNLGEDWTLVNWALPKYCVSGIGVAGTDISIATSGGMYRSTDNGTNWVRRTIHTYYEWADFTAIGFRNSTSGIVGDINGFVYTSTNAGSDWWNPTPPNGDTVRIEYGASITSFGFLSTYIFAATKPFLAGVAGGVYFSSDNGATWTRRSNGLPTLADTNTVVSSLAVIGNNLFAGTGHGVYKSTDNGTSWTQVSTGLIGRNVTSLVVKGTELYAGTLTHGVFRSNDNGANWSHSLLNKDVTALTVVDEHVFAGTWAQGVYWLLNTDSTWRYRGLSSVYVTSFATNNGYLFATTSNNTVWKALVSNLTPVETITDNIPDEFALLQNYPNPFNPSTKIEFHLRESGFVSLKVYDILGREIANLVNEEKPVGEYVVDFNAAGLASGIYLYKIETEKFVETKKMILMR